MVVWKLEEGLKGRGSGRKCALGMLMEPDRRRPSRENDVSGTLSVVQHTGRKGAATFRPKVMSQAPPAAQTMTAVRSEAAARK